MIQELGDLDSLATLPKLSTLSLMSCPVVTKQHYRLYVAFKLPNLKLLDFRKIKQKVTVLACIIILHEGVASLPASE